MPKRQKYYFYILRCNDGSWYCGIAKNPAQRQRLHNSGQGSKYVASRGGGKIAYLEALPSRGQALRREAEVKKWPRSKKTALVKSAARPLNFHGKGVYLGRNY